MKLTEQQIVDIKSHMLHEEDALKIKFKARNTKFDSMKVLHAEVESYENQGWIAGNPMKTKTPMTRKKEHGRLFEDEIWCMFYNLGFRTLNSDEKLVVQWGPNPEDKKQLDIVAVGDDAIFVVECKAAEKAKKQSFQLTLTEMANYKQGIADSLRQIYGQDKRVKFIFATRNYQIVDNGEDDNRMKNNGIYHLDDNAFNYINDLIKSYQSAVIYQFYGLMFKDELISEKNITIPALKGKMGGRQYYLFSIEPSTLLKIGFVLHRTRVNDSVCPTYQRLLIPKRLKGITKFIDEGGYFPNSIIIDFANKVGEKELIFDSIHKEECSDSEFGLLNIPNAYGIAYIIDGQHRVYGYANSTFKDKHTIPVVAFVDMDFEEQLEIFMQINENQKAVSKSLRIDLEQDLFWTSDRLDSRMKALRSATIKELCSHPGTILYNMIAIGEDHAPLSPIYFEHGFLQTDLIPRAKNTKWIGDTDACLYDVNETDIEKAMGDSRKRIAQFIINCYEEAADSMTEEIRDEFLMSNRGSFAFVALMGTLHSHLIHCGKLSSSSSISARNEKIAPYVRALADGLNNLPQEESTYLRGIQGASAEKKWLLSYQNIINKFDPDYFPEELKEWREMRDQNLQADGEKLKKEILVQLRTVVLSRLELVYGSKWENSIAKLKNDCVGKIIDTYGENDDFSLDDYDWKDWIELSDCKSIIEKHFSDAHFSEAFAIDLGLAFKTKKEKLAWLSLVEVQKGKKKVALTKSDVRRLELINSYLAQFISEE